MHNEPQKLEVDWCLFVFRAVTEIVAGVRYKRRFCVEPGWTPNTIKVGAMFGQGRVMLLGLCQPLLGTWSEDVLPRITEISHFNLQPFQPLVTDKFTHLEISFFSPPPPSPQHRCAAHYITRIKTNTFILENNANPS